MSAELLSQDEKDLVDLEARIHDGFRIRVLSLAEIYSRKLYESMGFSDFLTYCNDRLDIQKSEAYRLLQCAEVVALEDKKRSPNGGILTHERLIRDLIGMKAESKLKVLEVANARAEKQKLPLTGKLVMEVAKKNFHWKSRAEYRASKKAADPKSEAMKVQEVIEIAFMGIATIGLTGYELHKKLGSLATIPYAADALLILRDWQESE